MKKILFLVILFICTSVTGCKKNETKKEDELFNTYEYFVKNPSCLENIVEVENKKAPLAVQKYNKIKNNVVKIRFVKLAITNGTKTSCSGYFTTYWTIKSDYFGEEEYEYLIPCENIKCTKDKEYLIWKIVWPEKHPFADEL